jgi:hypothetical protein
LLPQLELRLIRRHQLHGGIRHGIGCCHQHGIGRMDLPAGDAVRLVAEQAGDGRLVEAEIGGKTGEAMAQHMGGVSAGRSPSTAIRSHILR